MSDPRHLPRARVALTLAALAPVLACASSSAKREPEPLARPPVESGAVGNTDGKTVETMLAGRFPGVTVSAAANGGLQIRIRGGNNSFYGGSEPLFIVDDVPLPAGSGGIVQVSPHDIERIEVLKNPSDVAIYGVRGANGVVKVTTKKPRPSPQ